MKIYNILKQNTRVLFCLLGIGNFLWGGSYVMHVYFPEGHWGHNAAVVTMFIGIVFFAVILLVDLMECGKSHDQ